MNVQEYNPHIFFRLLSEKKKKLKIILLYKIYCTNFIMVAIKNKIK